MLVRSGAMAGGEFVSGNIEFFTLYTTIDITATGNYANATQKDFESVVQVIALRSMPVIMNNPVYLDGVTDLLENFGAPSLTGSGWIFKFAFEHQSVHTLQTLVDELHGIVLNGGTVNTKTSINMEFTKQDLL